MGESHRALGWENMPKDGGREGGAGGIGQSLGQAGWERGPCGPAPEEDDAETPQERQPPPAPPPRFLAETLIVHGQWEVVRGPEQR